jgi:hypothetical protein
MTGKENLENFSDLIIRLHELARTVSDPDLSLELRQLADRLAKTGNKYHQLTQTQQAQE